MTVDATDASFTDNIDLHKTIEAIMRSLLSAFVLTYSGEVFTDRGSGANKVGESFTSPLFLRPACRRVLSIDTLLGRYLAARLGLTYRLFPSSQPSVTDTLMFTALKDVLIICLSWTYFYFQ